MVGGAAVSFLWMIASLDALTTVLFTHALVGMPIADATAINHANWESRVPIHAASADYRLERFITEPDQISEVVEFDRPRLGDIAGLDVVHLQCHMGNDSLSLARNDGLVYCVWISKRPPGVL